MSRPNRGPAAAAANRAAILAAARRLFGAQGYLVPLSAIAREAGVGQGVLYRHFRGRLDLAFAVFEDNLTELRTIARAPDADAFVRLWRTLLDQTVREAAFVEMVLETRHTGHTYDGAARLHSYLADTLPRARDAGLVAPEVTVESALLAWRMAFGLVVTCENADQARADLAAAQLLGIALG